MYKRCTAFALFFLLILSFCGCSSKDDITSSKSAKEPLSDGSESSNEEPDISLIDSFVDSYNKISETPISDLFDIEINDKESEYYRTEFRLLAYKDAPAKRGTIGGSTIDIVNYGATSKNSIRIYISSDSYESMKSIFERSVSVFDEREKEEFQKIYDKIDKINGVSFLIGKFNGYYEKSELLYTLMVDFGNVEK